MTTHILIIRPGAIGDTLLTFPILQHLRKSYATPRITFVGNAAVLPLARTFALVDEISDYEDTQWSNLFLSPPTNSAEHTAKRGRLQEILRGTDIAIGWLRDPEGTIEHNFQAASIHNYYLAPGRPLPTEHQHIVSYLAQTIGLSFTKETCWQAPQNYCWRQEAHAQSRPVIIHPGSGGIQKCWPVTHFAEVIRTLWERHIPVLLLGGPAEHGRLVKLAELLPPPPSPNLLHKLINAPLLTVAQHLQHCRGYLGNDSGITHLAALLDVPTIALFGPSDPVIWHPVGSHVTVLYEPQLEILPTAVVLRHLHSFS